MASTRTEDLPTLDQAGAASAALAGRKAATLARLRAAGFPVPDGFVVPPWALERALAAGGLGADSTQEQVPSAPVDERLAASILAAADRLGGPFAVRSSGVDEDGEDASHAGQYDSVLGVAGAAPLLGAIRTCWASAFSDRARAYRSARGLPRQGRLAVLVQRLVPADAAGVAFTANPVTGDRDEVVVSAVRGLGDRLVAGEVSAEEWVVREGGALGRPAGEGVLDAAQARAVAELARRVETYQGAPQDIEWALAGGEVFLLQARPITALPEEVPELTLGLVRDQLARGYDPRAEVAALAGRRAEAAAAARRLLAAHPAADQPRFERALARAERAYPVREDNEFFTTSAPLGLLRLAALEVGRRLAGRGQLARRDDVFLLKPAEARAALRSGTDQRELVARRKSEQAWVLAHPGPASHGKDPDRRPPSRRCPPRRGWR